MMCERSGCTKDARWLVYAAYDAEMDSAHPRVARYPNPMVRACGDHLTWELGRDAAARGSTKQWVVTPV